MLSDASLSARLLVSVSEITNAAAVVCGVNASYRKTKGTTATVVRPQRVPLGRGVKTAIDRVQILHALRFQQAQVKPQLRLFKHEASQQVLTLSLNL